ncbi:MAG: heme/hemin ABC transporter substrate-binding protein [Plesiomonas sp.]|uniref:heme/hemin ABC transporter substrate-binding protein n=1 Tax=Plesiomonas sp. TaxID=2486279 RepID=UPI003F3129BC
MVMPTILRLRKQIKSALFVCSVTLLSGFAVPAVAADRIISAGMGVTEIIVALGGQDLLVGTDSSSELPINSSAKKLGYIRQLPAEGMLALRPNQLIGTDEIAPQSSIDMLKQAGVTVTVLPSGSDIESLKQRITLLAQQLNKPSEGTALLHKTDTQLAELAKKRQHIQSKNNLNVIFLLLNEGRAPMVAGGNTPANTLISLAGATNPAEKVKNYQTVSSESLLAMQPDIIIISQRNWKGSAQAALAQFPILTHTPAGKNLAVYPINGKALIGGLGLTSLHEADRLADYFLRYNTPLSSSH